MLFNELKQHK